MRDCAVSLLADSGHTPLPMTTHEIDIRNEVAPVALPVDAAAP